MPDYSNKRIHDEWVFLARNQMALIHRHAETIWDILEEAACQFKTSSRRQKKRLFADTQHSTRIYLKDIHVYQHLVFLHSEKEEKRQEICMPASISENDMIIRYLAFIVRKILKRNSLYGVTGICRFICHYELKDVRKIHEALLDEPDYFRTDDDFRQNRKMMRDMIIKRFSKYLRVIETQKGLEKHFQLRENQNDASLMQLIKRSMDSFKPWQTNCLPIDYAAHEGKQGTFRHHDEHVCELRRLHALTHLDCFKTLIDDLGIAHLDASLGIPRFFSINSVDDDLPPDDKPVNSFASSVGSGANDGNEPVERRRLEGLRKSLASHSEKLKRFVAQGVLTVKMDDKDVASINLDVANRVRFTIDDEEAELIKIVSHNEQLILATHLMDDEVWQSQHGKDSYRVRHQSGAQITFIFKRRINADTGNNELLVTVTYKERKVKPALVFLWRRIKNKVLNWKKAKDNNLTLSGLNLQAPILSISGIYLMIPLLICASIVGFYSSNLSSWHNSFAPISIITTPKPDSNIIVLHSGEDKIETTDNVNKNIVPQERRESGRQKKLRGGTNNFRLVKARRKTTRNQETFTSHQYNVVAAIPAYLFEYITINPTSKLGRSLPNR